MSKNFKECYLQLNVCRNEAFFYLKTISRNEKYYFCNNLIDSSAANVAIFLVHIRTDFTFAMWKVFCMHESLEMDFCAAISYQ